MAESVPPPRAHELLPPLLACLPIAFMSSRPPPDLLTLLAPTLRQRVHMLSQGSAGADNWLPLLSWNAERASRVPGVVERLRLEPHPVSGEVEIEDPKSIAYQRLDAETLQARFELEEYELLPVYLYCLGDGQGNERGWKLTDLRTIEDLQDGTTWYGSVAEADEQLSKERAPRVNGDGLHHFNGERKDSAREEPKKDEDDDDSYWNSYDRTPGRTPNIRRSPAPAANSVQPPSTEELAYFARYMQEQQSTIDEEDGSAERIPAHETTLNGNTLVSQQMVEHDAVEEPSNLGPRAYDSSLPALQVATTDAQEQDIKSPTPASARSSSPIEQLERRAGANSSAEFGIKKHISYELKSLYRLSKAAGIDREEFEELIKTELECLSLLDAE